MSIRVAIIGTAGRNEDGVKMSEMTFKWMMTEAKRIITEEWKLSMDSITLVSGGSAWADHVAVMLYLDPLNTFRGLDVYMPSPLVETPTPKYESKSSNPGYMLNVYHEKFSKKMGRNTLRDIVTAKNKGAMLHSSKRTFFDRNTQIAKNCNFLLAFTWGDASPPPGGTKNTWDKCHATKLHISLLTVT